MSTVRARPWVGSAPAEVVLVAVHPDQDTRVLHTARDLAARVGAGLVCAWVDPSRRVSHREPDGTLDLSPIDPDADDELGPVGAADELADRIAAHLSDQPWRFVYLAGDVVPELVALSEAYAVVLVVVGSRRPGLAGWMNEAIGGSVAGRLAHTQSIPVVVVPLPGDGR